MTASVAAPEHASRCILLVVLACSAFHLAGCAKVALPTGLSARSTSGAPGLVGHSVAVYPPFSHGPEHAPAIATLYAAELLFSGEWAGIEFQAPSTLIESLDDAPEDFDRLEALVTRGLPADFEASGEILTIFEGALSEAGEDAATVKVTLQETTAGVVGLAPPVIEPELWAACPAEFALLSAPFGYYQHRFDIVALYGLVPFAGSSRLDTLSPRALFVLYDCSTGERMWESFISVTLSGELGGLDPDALPLLGVAYLLTHDFPGAVQLLQSAGR